ncbi:MAG: DUF4214 domain-containing protein, partial [Luminiphilus sp.]|nr:DUF4214 domain-containing protein [Luminiphilus sp.]
MGMNTASVQRLYVAYFNRPADPVSLAVYEAMLPTDRAATQAELLVVAETYFSPSPEYSSNFAGKSNSQIVDQLYQNIFGRSAEADGLISWATKLTDGSITVAELALQLSYSAQGTDAAVVNARIEAATTFTDGLDTAEEITGYSGDAAAAQGRTYLAQISGTLPTTEEAITAQKDTAITNVDASIASAVEAGGSTPGESYNLTVGIDSLTGTVNDDTFTGNVVGALDTGTTVQAGDNVTGGGGNNDTMSIAFAGSSGASFTVQALSLTGVEILDVTNFDADANDARDTTVDAVLMSGLTDVKLSSSNATGDTIIDNLANIVDLTVANGAADMTLTYNASVVAGTADTQNIKVSNTSAGDVTVAGVETVNVSVGSAAASLNDLVIANATTLNVTGANNLTIASDVDFADSTGGATALDGTVNAATFTGKLTFAANTGDNVNITGGTKADTFVMSSGLDTNDTVKGGDGGDTITMDSGTITTQFTNVSEVETVAFNDTSTAYSVAADKLGADVTTISMSIKDDTANGAETAFT